ncbi:MAG: hypothetical protein H6585_09345 [Flavobacteriales bacterium]|nr:hypothetical protein [Flavobacteriales bacterium]
MYTINTIDRLYARDQMLVAFSQFDHDSCSVSKNIASTIENNDFENLLEIVRLCKMNNNELPTGYDFAIDTYSKIQMILWHNLKSKNNFQRAWEQLFPYLEKAYFDGKISNSFLYAYDKLSYVHFGYQYYGTISAPVKDEATLKERQQDYKL